MNVIALHTYDHQVKYQYVHNYEVLQDQIELIKSLIDQITNGKDIYILLFNSIGTPNNIDTINNYSIDHLLYDIVMSKGDNDLSILEDQLVDMRTGLCPQGRSLRLIQVLQAWNNF